MTFVSKHGRRTSTEDLYREVLRRWRKCSATVWLLLFLLLLPHFCYCGALHSVTADHREMTFEAHNETTRRGSHTHQLPHNHHPSPIFKGGGRYVPDSTRPIIGHPKIPVSETDIYNSTRRVSASAKECAQRLNVTSSSWSSTKSRTATNSNGTQITPTTTIIHSNVITTAAVSSSPVANVTAVCKKQQPPFTRNVHQCLFLDELSAEDACGNPRSREQIHLKYCSQYHLGNLLPPFNPGDSLVCGSSVLTELKRLDEVAKLLVCQFEKLLELYDCNASYSVSWTCRECKEAYKQWVCAMVLPFYLKTGVLLKPCRSICRLVEQICPYFHPDVKEQYAGERVFKCIDPDIPDADSVSHRSVFGLPGHCYCPNHLDRDKKTVVDSDVECKLTPSKPSKKRKKPSTTLPTTTVASTTNFSTFINNNSVAAITQRLPQRTNTTPNSRSSSSSGGSGSGAWCVWTLLLSLLLTTLNMLRRTDSNGVSSLFSSGREPT